MVELEVEQFALAALAGLAQAEAAAAAGRGAGVRWVKRPDAAGVRWVEAEGRGLRGVDAVPGEGVCHLRRQQIKTRHQNQRARHQKARHQKA